MTTPLHSARRLLALATLLLVAHDAMAADTLAVLPPSATPSSPTWKVTLADFDSSQPLTGDSLVLPRSAAPHGPDNRVALQLSTHQAARDALTMTWHDAWYASLRFEATPAVDLRPFVADGAVTFDLDATDMAHAGLTFAIGCGNGCERKLAWVLPSRDLQGKGWQHLVVPLRCFARAGDDLGAVTQAFRLDSSGSGAASIANVRFEAHATGGIACPDYRTESVTPRPLEQVWSVDWWLPRHEEKLAAIRAAAAAHESIDLVFIGDSITHNWEKDGQAVWASHYARYHALDLGFGGDHTENVLWRLQHGELDGFRAKVAVVMIGTNNTGDRQEDPRTTAAGVRRILDEVRARQPAARILLLAVFPRDERPDSLPRRLNDQVNRIIAGFADGQHVRFLDLGPFLTEPDGTLSRSVMPDLLHPNDKGYAIWAERMAPALQDLLDRP